MKNSALLLLPCQQILYPLMFWYQYSPKEIIWWNKASLSIFLAHHMTATFSRRKLKWAKRGSFHTVLLLCHWSNPAPVHGHINLLASLGRWRVSAKRQANVSPDMGEKHYIFGLILAKEVLKILSNTILEYFWDLLFFLSPSLLFT